MATRIDRWLLAGYAGVAGFLVLEATVRPPSSSTGAAPGHVTTDSDEGTTRALINAYVVAAIAAPVIKRLPIRPLPAAVQPLGVGLQGVGLALRAWSMQSLQASYSRRLRVSNTQIVVESGPYKHIRHPGYLGSLAIWLGFALSSGSAAVVAAVAGLLIPAYRRRMEVEEQLLSKELRGYEEYRDRTKRLIPSVW
jgi:protein-S-isoprenylcysteine O-methyltransferase Ste14